MRSELVSYLFGVIAEEPRRGVEEHLLACSSCLRDFIELKRAAETAEAEPSAGAKARLRRAVAEELAQRAPRSSWSWWERPLALGLAGVVVIAAMMAVLRLSSSAGTPPRTMVVPSAPPG